MFNINLVYYLHEPWTELSLHYFHCFLDLVKSNDDNCIGAEWGYAVWKSPLNSIQIGSKLLKNCRKSPEIVTQSHTDNVVRCHPWHGHPSCHRDIEPGTIKLSNVSGTLSVYCTICVNALNVLRRNRSVSFFPGVDSAINTSFKVINVNFC